MLNLGTAAAKITLDISDLTSNANKANATINGIGAGGAKNLDTLQGKISTFGGSIQKVSTVVTGFGIAVTGAFGLAAKGAIGFDGAMGNVNSIAQLSKSQLADLTNQVLDLSKATGQAPTTLADGLYDIESSGFAGADALKILTAAANAANAGLTDTGTSAAVITAVLNSYSLGADQAGHASDVLFQTVNDGVVTFGQLSQYMGQTLPIASALNVPIEQLGAAYALMTKNGLPVAETQTDINALLTSAINPTSALTTAVQGYGYANAEALIKAKGLPGFLDFLTTAAGGSETELTNLLGTQNASAAAMLLQKENGKQYTDELTRMNDASKGVGATQTALTKQQETTAFKLKQLAAAFSVLQIRIGQQLEPVINLAAEGLTKLFNVISGLPTPVLAAIAAIGGVAGVLALVVGGIGLALPKILEMKTAFGEVFGLFKGGSAVDGALAKTGAAAAGTEAGFTAASAGATTLGVALDDMTVSATAAAGSLGLINDATLVAGPDVAALGTATAATNLEMDALGVSGPAAARGLTTVGVAGEAAEAGLIGTGVGAEAAEGGLAGLLGPISLIIAAAGALYIAYQTNFLGFATGVNKAASWIKGSLSGLTTGISHFVGNFKLAYAAMAPVKAITTGVSAGFKTMKAPVDAVGGAVSKVSGFLKSFSGATDSTKKSLDGVTGPAKSVGDAVNNVAGGFGKATDAVNPFNVGIGSASKHIQALYGTATGLARVFLALSYAFGQIGGGKFAWANNISAALLKVAKVTQLLQNYFKAAFGGNAEKLLNSLPAPLQGVAHGIGTVLDAAHDLNVAWDKGGFTGVIKELPHVIGNLGTAFRLGMSGVGDLFRSAAQYAGPFSGTLKAIGKQFDDVGRLGQDLAKGMSYVFKGDFSTALKWGKEAVSDFGSLAVDSFKVVGNALQGLGQAGATLGDWVLNTAAPKVAGWIADAAPHVWDAITSIAGWVWGGIEDLGAWTLDTAIPNVVGWVTEFAGDAWKAIKDAAHIGGEIAAELGVWALHTLPPGLQGWLGTFSEDPIGHLETAGANLLGFVAHVNTWALNLLPPGLSGWIKDFEDDPVSALQTAGGNLLGFIAPIGAWTMSLLPPALAGWIGNFADDPISALETAGSNLLGFVADVADWTMNILPPGLAGWIKDFESDPVGALKTAGANFVDGLVIPLGKFIMNSLPPGLAGWLEDFRDDPGGKIKELGGDVWDNIIVPLGKVTASIGEWFIKATAPIVGAVGDWISKAWGLLSGVSMGDLDSVIATITKFAVKASAPITSAIDDAVNKSFADYQASGHITSLDGTVNAKLDGPYVVSTDASQWSTAMDTAAQNDSGAQNQAGYKYGYVGAQKIMDGINAGLGFIFGSGGGGSDVGGGSGNGAGGSSPNIAQRISGYLDVVSNTMQGAVAAGADTLAGNNALGQTGKNYLQSFIDSTFGDNAPWFAQQMTKGAENLFGPGSPAWNVFADPLKIAPPNIQDFMSNPWGSIFKAGALLGEGKTPIDIGLPNITWPNPMDLVPQDIKDFLNDPWGFIKNGGGSKKQLPSVVPGGGDPGGPNGGFDNPYRGLKPGVDYKEGSPANPDPSQPQATPVIPQNFVSPGSLSSIAALAKGLGDVGAIGARTTGQLSSLAYQGIGAIAGQAAGATAATDASSSALGALGAVKAMPKIDLDKSRLDAGIADAKHYNGMTLATAIVSIVAKQAGAGAVSAAKGAAASAVAAAGNANVSTTTTNTVVTKFSAIDNASKIVSAVAAAINNVPTSWLSALKQVGGEGVTKIAGITQAALEDIPTSWFTGISQSGAESVTKSAGITQGALEDIPTSWFTGISESGAASVRNAAYDAANAIDSIPTSRYSTVSASVGGTDAVWTLVSALNSLHDVTVYVNTITTGGLNAVGHAKGGYTSGVPGWLAEQGPEALRFPDGSFGLASTKGIYSVPAGTYVYTAPKTAAMFDGNIPGYAKGGYVKPSSWYAPTNVPTRSAMTSRSSQTIIYQPIVVQALKSDELQHLMEQAEAGGDLAVNLGPALTQIRQTASTPTVGRR